MSLTALRKIKAELEESEKENAKLKQMLEEISSQLKDRGGFDILTLKIDEVCVKE